MYPNLKGHASNTFEDNRNEDADGAFMKALREAVAWQEREQIGRLVRWDRHPLTRLARWLRALADKIEPPHPG